MSSNRIEYETWSLEDLRKKYKQLVSLTLVKLENFENTTIAQAKASDELEAGKKKWDISVANYELEKIEERRASILEINDNQQFMKALDSEIAYLSLEKANLAKINKSYKATNKEADQEIKRKNEKMESKLRIGEEALHIDPRRLGKTELIKMLYTVEEFNNKMKGAITVIKEQGEKYQAKLKERVEELKNHYPGLERELKKLHDRRKHEAYTNCGAINKIDDLTLALGEALNDLKNEILVAKKPTGENKKMNDALRLHDLLKGKIASSKRSERDVDSSKVLRRFSQFDDIAERSQQILEGMEDTAKIHDLKDKVSALKEKAEKIAKLFNLEQKLWYLWGKNCSYQSEYRQLPKVMGMIDRQIAALRGKVSVSIQNKEKTGSSSSASSSIHARPRQLGLKVSVNEGLWAKDPDSSRNLLLLVTDHAMKKKSTSAIKESSSTANTSKDEEDLEKDSGKRTKP